MMPACVWSKSNWTLARDALTIRLGGSGFAPGGIRPTRTIDSPHGWIDVEPHALVSSMEPAVTPVPVMADKH